MGFIKRFLSKLKKKRKAKKKSKSKAVSMGTTNKAKSSSSSSSDDRSSGTKTMYSRGKRITIDTKTGKKISEGGVTKTTKTGRGLIIEKTSGKTNKIPESIKAAQRSGARGKKSPKDVLQKIIEDRMDQTAPRKRQEEKEKNWKGDMKGLGSNIAGGAFAISDLLTGEPIGSAAGDIGGTTMGKIYQTATGLTAAALAGYAAMGAGTAIIARVAPRMAGLLGIGRTAGGTATITRTGFKHGLTRNVLTGETRLVGQGAITTQRAFQVTQKTSVALAKRMAAMNKVTITNVLKNGIKLAYKNKKTIAGITGAQMLFTWFAADNVLASAAIYSRDVGNAVRYGQVSPEQAYAGLQDAQSAVNTARRFINIQTINPLILPFRRLLAIGAESTQRQIDLQNKQLGFT